MVKIVIDTESIWNFIKTPVAIAGILILVFLAAFAGYSAGKSGHVNATINITPMSGFTVKNFTVDGVSLAPDSVYMFSDQMGNHTINVTFEKRVCSRFIFTDKDFKSSIVRYFNDGNMIPAGGYTLDVIGWDSRWSEDKGWYEEGETETTHKIAAWRDLTALRIGENTINVSTIANGSFDHANSTGSALVTLSHPSRVGILINDDTYEDNRGSAIFVLRDMYDLSCVPG